MTRKEKAIELHDKGFNCAQAVACAFAEETGIPEEISALLHSLAAYL